MSIARDYFYKRWILVVPVINLSIIGSIHCKTKQFLLCGSPDRDDMVWEMVTRDCIPPKKIVIMAVMNPKKLLHLP